MHTTSHSSHRPGPRLQTWLHVSLPQLVQPRRQEGEMHTASHIRRRPGPCLRMRLPVSQPQSMPCRIKEGLTGPTSRRRSGPCLQIRWNVSRIRLVPATAQMPAKFQPTMPTISSSSEVRTSSMTILALKAHLQEPIMSSSNSSKQIAR